VVSPTSIMATESKPMLRVLFLFPGPRWDMTHEFSNRVAAFETRIAPYVFSSANIDLNRLKKNSGITAFDYVRKDGVFRKAWYYARYLFHAYRMARRIVAREGRLDLIVSYDPLATGIVGVILSRFLGTKIICEVNGIYTDHVLYRQRTGEKIKRMLNMRTQDLVLSLSHGIKFLFDGQSENNNLSSKHILTLFNHVEHEHFYVADGQKVVLGLGAPFHVKGFDILVKAFNVARESHPDWRLVIVGHFEGEEEEIEKIINSTDAVEIRKAVYHRDIAPLMAGCEVLAAPSRTEGIPRVLVEAMYARKARVGSRVGGIPSVIEDGEDGLLCQPDNVADLATKLDELMGDEKLRQRLAEAGHKRGTTTFGLDRYVEKYADFMEQVVCG